MFRQILKNFFLAFNVKPRLIQKAVLVLGLLSVIAVWFFANQFIKEKQLLRFESTHQDLIDKIQFRIERYPAVLRSTRAFVEFTQNLTLNKFHYYVESLDIIKRYPGTQGIGYVPRVQKTNLNSIVAKAKNEIDPNYTVLPNYDREEYYPILYLEPANERNKAALGYDMFTEPIRNDAMVRARDTGVYALSGMVTLRQEISSEVQPGFLIYVPIYSQLAQTLSSVEERKEKLIGYLYAPFRAHDFFSGTIGMQFEGYSVQIYDSKVSRENLLFHSQPKDGGNECENCFKLESNLVVGGRIWVVKTVSLSDFGDENKLLVYVFCIVQFFLVMAIWLLSKAQSDAYDQVEEATIIKDRLLASERAARSEVERAARMKDEFLATVSHELRSPLNAILGWAQLINRANITSDHVAKGLDTIERNVRIQAQLIEDLLDMSRIVSGKLKLEIRPVDIRSVINASIDTVTPAIEAKKIIFNVDLRHDHISIMGDAGRIQQVIWNVLSNAIKFSPSGGSVSVYSVMKDEMLCIVIKDNGIGISPEFLPYMFDRFRQADATITRKHGGLGLGLAISKHITELHGGDITVESDGENKGAKFVICLPINHSIRLNDRGNKAPAFDMDQNLAGKTALIVDDETDAREVLQRILEEAGMSVVAAGSVSEALKLLEHRSFCIIVSDLGMPEQDGFDFAKKVRAHHNPSVRKMPMVALSALARMEDRQRAMEAGFTAHIAKPLDASTLTATLATLLKVNVVK